MQAATAIPSIPVTKPSPLRPTTGQFEKEEQIHGIDIGNEGSAFVEVLVGSSASPSEQDYEVSPPPAPHMRKGNWAGTGHLRNGGWLGVVVLAGIAVHLVF